MQVGKLRLGVRHIDRRGRGRLEEFVLALGRAGGRLGLELGAAIKQLLHEICECASVSVCERVSEWLDGRNGMSVIGHNDK